MTIVQFAEIKNKKIKTVLKWIYDGFLPNASVDNDYVPDSAREPYFSRAKESSSIYYSIVYASSHLKHVSNKTYGLTIQEFNSYIDRLIAAGLIEKRIEDGVTYYDATPKVADKKKRFILDAIAAGTYGITKALKE